uniref:Uncharacterized protein n=1 Tax=Romanomermis culicivorax TaxID=13658 RepID=A0A915JKZ9_ROMCU
MAILMAKLSQLVSFTGVIYTMNNLA